MEESPLSFDWHSSESALFLNPRMSPSDRAFFENSWSQCLQSSSLQAQIGIATSGSSGDGRGRLIAIGKQAFLTGARAVNERFQVAESDSWMKTLPDFHVGGLGIRARARLSGSQVYESRVSKWSPEAFHRELLESRASLLSLVPTQLFDLVQAGLHSPRSLRAVIIGGGRLSEDLRLKARGLGWPVYPSYGLTECGSQVATALGPDDPRLIPLSHVKMRIEDSGKIAIQSRALLTGWIRFSEKGFVFEDPKQSGWFITEDRGQIEGDQSLTILGREQDFVKISGEGVILSRLEEEFEKLRLAHGLKDDFALLAAADQRLGAQVVLLTTAREESVKDLLEAFHSKVMPYEKVRFVYQVAEIPRSAIGKLLRAEALALVGLKPPSNL